jgi:hypothetical protein
MWKKIVMTHLEQEKILETEIVSMKILFAES